MITVDHVKDLLVVRFKFSHEFVERIRKVPGRKWNPDAQHWTVPASEAKTLARAFEPFSLAIDPALLGETEEPELEVPKVPKRYIFKTEPYDHQRIAFSHAVTKKRFALLMEMGTGKTKVAIDALQYWYERKDWQVSLVLAPKAILHNWTREVEVHGRSLTARVIEGTPKQKVAIASTPKPGTVYVMNYEGLLNEDLFEALQRLPIGAMILDESTRIKNPKARQTKLSWKLGKHVPLKLVLTGTPITQSPLDAFGQFFFLDPAILRHTSYYSFRNEFAQLGGFNGKQVVAYRNLPRLKKRIHDHSFRVLKRDCLDLPPKVYRRITFKLDPKQMKVYEQMQSDAVVALKETTSVATNVLVKLMRLQQITSGYIGDEDGEVTHLPKNAKLEVAREVIEEVVEGGHKVIVWTRFRPDIELLSTALRKAKIDHVTFHGDTADRQGTIDRFQNERDVSVFLGQIQTGGMGITLTAADYVVYYSNSFSLQDRLQSEDRPHRIGQDAERVTYIDLVAEETVDELVLDAISQKKNVADYVTGDAKNILSQLERK